MSRLRRVLRRLTLGTLLLGVLAIAGALVWLVATESGARFAIANVSALTPNLKVRHASGSLLGPLQLSTLVVKTPRMRLELRDLSLDWSAACLLLGEVCVRELRASLLSIATPPPAPGTPLSAARRRLPALSMPLRLEAGRVSLDRFELTRGDRLTRFTGIQAALSWQGSMMRVDELRIGMPSWEAGANGRLETRDDWPVDAWLDFRVPRTGTTVFSLSGTAVGSLSEARLQLTAEGRVKGRIDGTLEPLQPGLPFRATATVPEFRLSPAGPPERSARLEDIGLSAEGKLLDLFRIDGRARLDTPFTPVLATTARATGTWRGLDSLELRIDEPGAKLVARSDYRWLGGQHFRGTVEVGHLDLALVSPKLPSALSGRIELSGDIDPEGTRFRLEAAPLAGRFRQWPLALQGPLLWQAGRWHFDGLAVEIGRNRAVIDGELGEQWQARARLELAELSTLVPGLAGRADGTATLEGPPGDPVIPFSVTASNLRLPPVTLPAPVARTVQLPAGDWQLAGRMTLRELRLDEAITLRAPFRLAGSGLIGWQDGLAWDLATDIRQLSLGDLAPELDGTVAGALLARGRLGTTLDALTIHADLAGQGRDRLPLRLETALDYGPRRLQIESLQLAHGDNRLNLAGMFSDEALLLAIDADLPRLSASISELTGSLRLKGHIEGPREAPDLDLDLAAGNLSWADWRLTRLETRIALDEGGRRDSAVELALGGLARGDQTLDSLWLKVAGTEAAHGWSMSTQAGPLSLALTGDGGLGTAWRSRPEWKGRLATGEAGFDGWRWNLVGEPLLNATGGQLLLGPQCWTDGSARACLTQSSRFGRSGHVDAEAFHLPLQALLNDALPLDTRVDGRLGGWLRAAWTEGRIDQLAVSVRNADPIQISVGDAVADDVPELARFATAELDAEASAAGGGLILRLGGGDAGELTANIAVQADEADTRAAALPPELAGPLDGRIELAGVQLGLIEAFTYQVNDVRGTLGGLVSLGGRIDAPAIRGRVALSDGHLAFTRLPLELSGISLNGVFDGEQARLDGTFQTPDSDGKAVIGGNLVLRRGAWEGTGTLTGERLLLANPPEYQFSLDPGLEFEFRADRLRLTGEVGVPAGRLEMKSLPARTVARSADVIVIRAEQVVDAGGLPFRQDIDLDFRLGEDVRFRAFGGNGRLGGGLRLRSTPELPLLVDGELHLHEGKYGALGQALTIKQGDVIFNGPADQPLIDALAVRPIDDPSVREVGLRLTGSLRDPQTTLWSVPAMSNEEVLAWLTTGRPLADGPLNLRGEAAQAALSLGTAQGSAILTAAGQEIGLQDVQLATRGEGEKSELQVGTHLNERVFVGYNRRVFSGDESVMVRLHLTRKLMLEALSGLDSALDLFYTFEF